jgi:hypothetical protein
MMVEGSAFLLREGRECLTLRLWNLSNLSHRCIPRALSRPVNCRICELSDFNVEGEKERLGVVTRVGERATGSIRRPDIFSWSLFLEKVTDFFDLTKIPDSWR